MNERGRTVFRSAACDLIKRSDADSFQVWRTGRDSNPRNLSVRRVSSAIVSTTHSPVRTRIPESVDAGQASGCGGISQFLAERQGFEPWRRYRLRTFQARAFDHSATAP